jgi:hypothetical protein
MTMKDFYLNIEFENTENKVSIKTYTGPTLKEMKFTKVQKSERK